MAQKQKQKSAPAVAKAAPPASPPKRDVAVVATRMGYYGLRRIRDGQEFQLKLASGEKLPSWVKLPDLPAAQAGPSAPPPELDPNDGGDKEPPLDPVI